MSDTRCALERIQMDVAYQLLGVDLFLTNDLFVTVLKELAVAPVATIETDGVTGRVPR